MSGRLLADASSLLIFVVIARNFGAEGVGNYSTSFALATLMFDLVSLGIEDYGVREYSRCQPTERPVLLRRLLRVQLLVALACATGVSIYCYAAPLTGTDILALWFLVSVLRIEFVK